jgi:hypothetical protein
MTLPEIPGFRLETQLGEGAYGRVYLAHEVQGLTRPVALKVFSAEGHAAYTKELEILKRIEELRRQGRHPEILQALDSGEHNGQGWIALEYLEEGSLKDVVDRRGPLPWAEALDAIQQATAAVAVLHTAGLFHRDVKPANLLMGADGRVRLGDFGLSRDLDGTLSTAGSPAFAAPEVIAGQVAADQRARVDVYGLGATLVFLLTGAPARPGRPDVFALERSGAPRPVCDLLLEAMAYEPDERPADAQALATLLKGVTKKVRTHSTGREGAVEEDNPMKQAVKTQRAPAPDPRTDLDLAVQRPRCPFCHEPIELEDTKQACVECMAWHHDACWSEHGRCATCQAVAVAPLATQARPKKKGVGLKILAVIVGMLTAFLLLGVMSWSRFAAAERFAMEAEAEAAEAPQAGEAEDAAVAVGISHVKVGQRYHFHMNNIGTELDQVWEVTAIGDDEIKYNLTTIMDGKALGNPTALTWAVPAPAVSTKLDPKGKPVEFKEETVTIAGREWNCYVIENNGYTSWCPKESFPAVVRTLKDGVFTSELTRIEEPLN